MSGRFLYPLLLALAASSCGPATPGPATGPGSRGAAPDPLDVFEQQVAAAVVRARASVVALEYSAADAPAGTRRVASGVVIGDDGDVLSVRIDPPPPDSPPILARDASGREVRASWVAADPETGLTLLKIPPDVARPPLPAQHTPTPGQPVLVIGNPFGLGHSVSRGAVAGLNRRLELAPRQIGGLIQVDASLHPGDSGALLVDLRGGWLGLIRSGLATPAAPESDDRDRRPAPAPARDRDHDHDLGFAIPAADALWVAGQLRAHGRVDRAYLGVIPSPRGASSPVELEPQGVPLDQVLPDTPAGRAGLKPGDHLVAVDDQPIHTTFDLDDRLARTAAGTEVTVAFLRGDSPIRERQTLTIRTARRPLTDAPKPSPRPKPAPPDTLAEKDKDKTQPSRTSLPPGVAERLEQLERRIHDLEAEKARRDPGAGVARRP